MMKAMEKGLENATKAILVFWETSHDVEINEDFLVPTHEDEYGDWIHSLAEDVNETSMENAQGCCLASWEQNAKDQDHPLSGEDRQQAFDLWTEPSEAHAAFPKGRGKGKG